MKPLFKWSGGKTKEIPVVGNYLPENINTYYEPFIGGGAVWLGLEHKGKSVINDFYDEVSNFYNVLRTDGYALLQHLEELSKEYNSMYKEGASKDEAKSTQGAFYYNYRSKPTNDPWDKAVRFWILRQLSFQGMLRFNRKGEFNVPWGWYKRLKSISKDDYDFDFLKNTEVRNGDFIDGVKGAAKGDFVFLDPPYTTTFSQYNPTDGFGEEDHRRLADWFYNTDANVMIIINSDEFTRSLYKDYIVEEYDYSYSIRFRDRVSNEDNKNKHFVALNYKK